MVAAPRRPFDHPRRAGGAVRRLEQRRREVRDVKAAIRDGRTRRDEPLQEEVAERLVMPVQLPVGGDDDEPGLAVRERGPGESRRDALAGEPVGVGGRRRLERDRGR